MPLSLENAVSGSPSSLSVSEGRLCLPRNIDTRVVDELRSVMMRERGRPLELHADDVALLGAQAAMLFVSSRKTWQADGQHFSICNPSAAFVSDLQILGLAWGDVSAI